MGVWLLRRLGFGLLCRFHTETRHVQFDDHAVMHEAIDRCCGRHRILEDLVPFAESEIARQQHASAFVAFCKERKQHLHLLATLLHVAQIIDDQPLKVRHLSDHLRKTQIALRNQQLLHQQTARRKQQAAALQDQLF